MQLHVLSDLHNEFAPFVPSPSASAAADVIVLAGDIDTGVKGIQWARATWPDKPLVYVAGNHEFYGHSWVRTLADLRQAALAHQVHFLEDNAIEINGIRVLGCSLWTDFELFGKASRPLNMLQTQQVLNDYRRIKNDSLRTAYAEVNARPWRLTPEHTRRRHLASRAWLQEQLAAGDPQRTIVVTHHFPHINSCAPRWREDPVSAGFGSQLPLEMLAGAKLWIHGHTHDSCDYVLWHQSDHDFSETRVVCNPRGYPMRSGRVENERFDPELMIEV